ncbi:hypothetical protein [Microterricola viridarii]|uniref:Uncharacterized protein n=1 Tax=Microterricola viridarii TaxID=412690 RepID=A0A0Y0N6G7_9MICO|nr:hypothetical protein [Microterricola viridarii]AMB58108.1 hypothetical protein AWU67_03665 [Microterricola viridarii]
MSDLAKHLPLSQGQRGDDSAVDGDWSGALALVLHRIAGMLERMPAERWAAAGGCPGWSPAESAALLLWRLRTPARERRSALWGELPRHPLRPAQALEQRVRASAERTTAGAIAELKALADQPATQPARIGDLAAAVCAAIDISAAEGAASGIAPLTSGAVALYQVQRAPYAVRAAVRGSRLYAADADWSVGRGTVRESDAETILRFLFGRGTRLPGS